MAFPENGLLTPKPYSYYMRTQNAPDDDRMSISITQLRHFLAIQCPVSLGQDRAPFASSELIATHLKTETRSPSPPTG